ncbi:MAG: class I SAM-dependent methyltransferase [Proteobacteria bacterium]|nr:class I SAM-dependent methyltransferase [Pseudomonadota bacterium]
MNNTAKSFHDKWTKNETLAFEDTSRPGSDTYNWILTRNGFADGAALKNFLEPKKRILDAGCGNGRVTNLLHQHAGQHAQLVGIDLVAADVAKNNLSHLPRISTYSKDLLAPLDDLGVFDFIYCQEVLHHTKDPRAGFLNLCTLLEKNGEIAIYVYKKKAPVREYVDDFVRQGARNSGRALHGAAFPLPFLHEMLLEPRVRL